MNNSPDEVASSYNDTTATTTTLSYDDTIPYEDQLPSPQQHGDASSTSLKKRIGTAKLYLLSETSVARAGPDVRVISSRRPIKFSWNPPSGLPGFKRHIGPSFTYGKRKLADAEDENRPKVEGAMEVDDDVDHRSNALLLQGPPIAHLPTARLFAYAKHFHQEPMGLEWVDDTTCVLVFSSKAFARAAFSALRKSSEEPDSDSFVGAHPIPVALWPPEERIGASLGKAQGLKGSIRMRWAVEGDVKKKGARERSEFYRKHGTMAGKELYDGEGVPPAAKRRRAAEDELEVQDLPIMTTEVTRAQLDAELDEFLAKDNPEEERVPTPQLPPPSRMRSDYIAADGRTLLERTATLDLASRITAPLPQRGQGGVASNGRSESLRRGNRRGGERRPRRSGEPRKKVTQQELDEEMDAFWKQQP